MCALCGVLGGPEHWTDAAPRDGIFTRNTDTQHRRRERMARVARARRILGFYRLGLSDWQGASFVLSAASGKTQIVEDMTHLWAAAEALRGRPCDPLDPDLIAYLETHDA
jgi:hypothetical protein